MRTLITESSVLQNFSVHTTSNFYLGDFRPQTKRYELEIQENLKSKIRQLLAVLQWTMPNLKHPLGFRQAASEPSPVSSTDQNPSRAFPNFISELSLAPTRTSH